MISAQAHPAMAEYKYRMDRIKATMMSIPGYGGKWEFLLSETLTILGKPKPGVSFEQIFNFVQLIWEKDFAPKFGGHLILDEQLQKQLDRGLRSGVFLFEFKDGVPFYWNARLHRTDRKMCLGYGYKSEYTKIGALLCKVLWELNSVQINELSLDRSLLDIGNSSTKGFTAEAIMDYVRFSHWIRYPQTCSKDLKAQSELLAEVLREGLTALVTAGKIAVNMNADDGFTVRYRCLFPQVQDRSSDVWVRTHQILPNMGDKFEHEIRRIARDEQNNINVERNQNFREIPENTHMVREILENSLSNIIPENDQNTRNPAEFTTNITRIIQSDQNIRRIPENRKEIGKITQNHQNVINIDNYHHIGSFPENSQTVRIATAEAPDIRRFFQLDQNIGRIPEDNEGIHIITENYQNDINIDSYQHYPESGQSYRIPQSEKNSMSLESGWNFRGIPENNKCTRRLLQNNQITRKARKNCQSIRRVPKNGQSIRRLLEKGQSSRRVPENGELVRTISATTQDFIRSAENFWNSRRIPQTNQSVRRMLEIAQFTDINSMRNCENYRIRGTHETDTNDIRNYMPQSQLYYPVTSQIAENYQNMTGISECNKIRDVTKYQNVIPGGNSHHTRRIPASRQNSRTFDKYDEHIPRIAENIYNTMRKNAEIGINDHRDVRRLFPEICSSITRIPGNNGDMSRTTENNIYNNMINTGGHVLNITHFDNDPIIPRYPQIEETTAIPENDPNFTILSQSDRYVVRIPRNTHNSTSILQDDHNMGVNSESPQNLMQISEEDRSERSSENVRNPVQISENTGCGGGGCGDGGGDGGDQSIQELCNSTIADTLGLEPEPECTMAAPEEPVNNFTRKEYYIHDEGSSEHKVTILEHLKILLEKHQSYIFCKHEETAIFLASHLRTFDINCGSTCESSMVHMFFNSGMVRVLIVTDETSRPPEGLKQVPLLFNYDFPDTPELYIERRRLLGYSSDTPAGKETSNLMVINLVADSDQPTLSDIRRRYNDIEEIIMID